jgi:SAM-dependent methyltransferase
MSAPSRNDPCPCGSQVKFKKCCAGKASAPAMGFDARTSMAAALAAHQIGKLSEAMALYGAVLEREPLHGDALILLGAAHYQQGNIPSAIFWMEKSTRAVPGSSLAHGNLAACLKEDGQLDRAISHALLALNLDENPQSRSSFCACALHMRFGAATPELEAALAKALDQAWTRPAFLAPPALSAALLDPLISQALTCQASSDEAPMDLWGADDERWKALVSSKLLRSVLKAAPLMDLAAERLLGVARLRLATSAAPLSEDEAALARALAKQGFLNEYIWAQAEPDHRAARVLRTRCLDALNAGALPGGLDLALLACFEPLSELPGAGRISQASWERDIEELVDLHVRRREAERVLEWSTPKLTAFSDAASLANQAQYEANPYPRWERSWAQPELGDAAAWAARSFPTTPLALPEGQNGGWDILIAGCGTGQQPCERAMSLPRSRVMALDLSAASLAYARRSARDLGLDAIEWAQADIAELGSWNRQFDMVESVGVLHHMKDPEKGLGILARLTRPGGLMKLGLYSRAARTPVWAARAVIERENIRPDLQGLRGLRERVKAGEFPELSSLALTADFHCASEWRDLVFHVQESCFDLLEIEAALSRAGLKFLGFSSPPRGVEHFKALNPDPSALADLKAWNEFERAHPDTFLGMYQFHAQKM